MREETCEMIFGKEAMYGLEPRHFNLALDITEEVCDFEDFVEVFFETRFLTDVRRYNELRCRYNFDPLPNWYDDEPYIQSRKEQIQKLMGEGILVMMEEPKANASDPRHRITQVNAGTRVNISPACLVYYGMKSWMEASSPKTLWLGRLQLLRSECIQRQGVERTKKRLDGVEALINEWPDDKRLQRRPLDECLFTKLFNVDSLRRQEKERLWAKIEDEERKRILNNSKPITKLTKRQMAMFDELEYEIEE